MSTQELPAYTEQEVASHNTPESLWIIIEDKVYDVTAFQDSHPGGQEVLLDNAGKDATSAFAGVGHSQDAVDLRDGTYLIGTLKPANAPSQGCSGCGHKCGALTIGVAVVVAAAAAVGIYYAYKALRK